MGQSQLSWQTCGLLLAIVVLITERNFTSAVLCTTMTSAAGSRVQCSRCRLTRLPAHIPDDVIWLDMSSNFLTSLEVKPHLSRLHHLDVSRNNLSHLPEDGFLNVSALQSLDLGYNGLGTLLSGVFSGLTNVTVLALPATGQRVLSDTLFRSMSHLLSLDLSSNSLSRIPSAALQYVTNLQHLDLSTNALTTVHNYSLSTLSNLQHLILHSNHLTSLQSAAFVGLEKLITLDLRFNRLEFDSGYPPDIFAPLLSLENLYMFGNSREYEGEYPRRVFDPLQSLKCLSIDSFSDPHFGVAFKNLTTLSSLAFSSEASKRCKMKWIRNTTFSVFQGSELQTLIIHACPVLRVEPCAFCRLPRLTTLTVSYSRYVRLSDLLLALYGLQNQTLEEVTFSHIRNISPIVLGRKITMYMNNVCIQRLNMQKCKITGISVGTFDFNGILLKCLKHLDLSWNAITGGPTSQFFKLSLGLTVIESFAMHNQFVFSIGNKRYHHLPSEKGQKRPDVLLYINTAPSLSYMNMSAGFRDFSKMPRRVHFPNGGNLTVIDLSYCGAYWCDAVSTGLTNIRTLDLSGNDCYVMGDWLFRHMSTLRRLMLSNVYLREEFLFSNGTSLLSPLRNLEELDMSANHLRSLPTDLLKQQPGLRRLALAGNQFEDIPLDISQLTFLQDLDLRDNQIHILTPSEQHVLDGLADNHTITLRLRGNPLSCTCQALDMISWLGRTMVRLDGDNRNEGFDDDYDDNGRDYPCVLEDGSMSSTWSVMTDWESHWRHCVGLSFFTVSLVAQLLQLLGLMMTYLVWSNWTLLVHKWYVLRHVKLPQRADFVHDALLVYASDEHRMAVRMKDIMRNITPGLRLALVEDEIPLGAFPPDLMVESMDRSWKIIVVVTQDFMEDDLSGYTVLHVQAKLSDTMPRRVLLLYVGDLRPGDRADPVHLSMRRLLHMLPESNVYHVPHDIANRPVHPVWFVLTQAIVEE